MKHFWLLYRTCIPLLLLALLAPPHAAPPVSTQTTVTDLTNRAYFPIVHKELQNATESISAAMYLLRRASKHKDGNEREITINYESKAKALGMNMSVLVNQFMRPHI